MAKHLKIMACDCGNEIRIIDQITAGHKIPDTEMIYCSKCGKRHEIRYSGTMQIESGASLVPI